MGAFLGFYRQFLFGVVLFGDKSKSLHNGASLSGTDFEITKRRPWQPSMLTNALMYGLARHRVLLATPYPSSINCPLNNDYSLNEMFNQIEHNHLFGAVVQLDRDDVNNVCGEGPFPLFRKVLDRLCTNAECSFNGYVRDTRDCGQYYSCDNGFKTTHHCPVGHSFDLCQSTCQPILQVNCNSTTCVVSGNLPNGMTPIRYPIPFPNPSPNCSSGGGGNNGGGNNGGGNNGGGGNNNQTSNCCCDVIRNLTTFFNNTAQLSQFALLIKELGVDDLVGTLRPSLQGLVDLVASIVDPVNRLLAVLLNGEKLMNDTMNNMSGLGNQGNVLSLLVNALTQLLQGLLGGLPVGGASNVSSILPLSG
uniref:Chitin-binding type-2 domain-containing protein n=1 Tax=Anopheles culicifacies TaxID=139723 RepID=A0A182M9R2_9DIPT